jgi:AcrR family transcriptional regulator
MSPTPEFRTDRRPALVICAYDPDDTDWDPVEDLSGTPWSPDGARTVAVSAADPEALARILRTHLETRDCRALLLVGRTHRSDTFQIQMRADNRALHGGVKLTSTGPATARTTAPVAEMVRALNDAGLAAGASSDGEEDVGSFLLYSLLTGLPDNIDAPAVGLLRAPIHMSPTDLNKGVRITASAIARHLSPLPRQLLA